MTSREPHEIHLQRRWRVVPMPDPSPSETLRAAAARIRACSPFVLIAGKRVAAEPLAAWLQQEAEWISSAVHIHREPALAFARSILEQP